MSPMARRHTPETFWAKVDRRGGVDACWPWLGAIHVVTGYGQVRYQSRFRKAHQVAFEITNGPMPEGLEPDHTCRNRQSQARKWASRSCHGVLRGEAQPLAKLTDGAVREIRASQMTTRALARRFGVSCPVIADVRNGRTWRHVT